MGELDAHRRNQTHGLFVPSLLLLPLHLHSHPMKILQRPIVFCAQWVPHHPMNNSRSPVVVLVLLRGWASLLVVLQLVETARFRAPNPMERAHLKQPCRKQLLQVVLRL